MHKTKSAFTLIELSIVLVIIGLIVGGVLVGRDLISASAVRAQISQIEKFNQAANTFRTKYNYLPGDIPDPDATRLGFITRGPYPGTGDGNSVIEGNCSSATCQCGFCVSSGEAGSFWVDLTRANLIEGNFTTNTPTTYSITASGSAISRYFPEGKIGRGNFIYVYSGGYDGGWNGSTDGINYFGLSANLSLDTWTTSSTPGLTVKEAFSIDSKIDDGFPQSGRVQANYYNYTLSNYRPAWAAGGGVSGAGTGGYAQYPSNAATSGSATTCFDNNGASGVQKHSMGQNSGAGVNCALSFKFQ